MRKIVALIAVVIVVCSAVPAFSASKKAARRKKNATVQVKETPKKQQNVGLKELQAEALNGNPEAQYNLGFYVL